MIRPCLDIASRALQLEEPGSDLCSVWFREGQGAYQLRLAHYVLSGGGASLLYGEHTDYDGLTFLWRNRSNGLQAWLEAEGQWLDIPLLETHPNALLINLGDLMEFWTCSRWHSPLHRVRRSTTTQGSPTDLVSVVMFAGPHPHTKLSPLASPLLPSSTNTEDTPLITAGQHVRAKIGLTATQADCSTLIGPGPSRLGSHWLRSWYSTMPAKCIQRPPS